MDTTLLARAREARRLLAVDVVLGLGVALVVLAQATVLAHVLARSFAGGSLSDVARGIVAFAALSVARGCLGWGFEVVGGRAGVSLLSRLRSDVVDARLRTGGTTFGASSSAEVATLVVHGLEPLETYFARFLPQVVLALVVPIAVLAWVLAVDPTSAFVMLVTLPLVPVFMALIGRHTARRTRERAEALALLASHFLDVVRGLPTLRAFGRSRAQVRSLAETGERYRTATMGTLRVAFLSGAVLELAATLGIALVAVTVGVRLVDGRIGLQAALTVLLLAPELYLPLRSVGAQYHASADGTAVAGRLLDLVEETLPPSSPSRPLPVDDGTVVALEGVCFAYPGRSGLVLDDLGLELRAGQMLALVGPSGSGKTTLASVVLGLVAPTSGHVRRAGVPIAWVPQRATIFAGSLADNVRLGDPAANDGRVLAALELAGARDLVDRLPDGVGTQVGDGGRPLSAGETQRVALARAFLCDAPLVVLDEPTANLDPASAESIGEAIERLRPGRTLLVIAHRPELVRRADRVVHLDGGRAVMLDEASAA